MTKSMINNNMKYEIPSYILNVDIHLKRLNINMAYYSGIIFCTLSSSQSLFPMIQGIVVSKSK